jgi:hypothetical protein
MISLQLRALVGGAGKGVVLAPLRDGEPGGVTFSHLPGKIPARTNTEEGTRAFITILSAFLIRHFKTGILLTRKDWFPIMEQRLRHC